MIIYELTVGVGYVNAIRKDTMTVEEMGYTYEDWEKLDNNEKEEILQKCWKDWSNNFIDGGWNLLAKNSK